MIDLSHTELIITLTSVTPRDGRPWIETREQVLMSSEAIRLFTKCMNTDGLTDAETGHLQETVFDQINQLMRRVGLTIESDMSRSEWNAAGRPDLESQ